jgi:DNA-binding response OmpR family regulator
MISTYDNTIFRDLDRGNHCNDIPKIMVVDDEPDIVFAFKSALELNGYEVSGFTDPFLALKNFTVGLYDLIVIDIKMPTINGFELYKLLKIRDNNANICFVTAAKINHEDYLNRPFELDSIRIIRKPISNEELLDYIALMIKRSETSRLLCLCLAQIFRTASALPAQKIMNLSYC